MPKVKSYLDGAPEVAHKSLSPTGGPGVKLFATRDSYRAGDRVFAILQRPDVALLLTCEAPKSWNAMVFDLGKKQSVAAANNHASIVDAQKYVLAQIRAHYKVAPAEAEIRWQQALNRPDILQT
jgi:hypothetical protein